MAISDKATEFAGLPVIDYHPAVGLVLPTMPRREFRSEDGKTTWAVALDGKRITVEDGGRKRSKSSRTPEAAREQYRKLIAEKVEEDYTEQQAEGGSLHQVLVAAIRADPDDEASRNAFLDYLAEKNETLPAAAYRVDSLDEYCEDEVLPHLESLLADPAAALMQALVIGWWGGEESDAEPDEVIAALIAARDRLPNLRALFFGDITYDQNEISWINQGDVTGLLKAFPKLEHFRARGGGGLELRKFKHEQLKSLTLEASNLPRKVVRAVGECDLPALEHLELWLGTSNYGANTKPADLKGILQGAKLPALRYLGLRNSEIADAVAAALGKAPVLERLRVLDLSLGMLTDAGAEALLAIPAIARLEKLDIHHHYVSDEVVERLRGLGIEVDAGEPRGDEDYRYVAHAE
jgi:hypothetical protein